MNNECVDVFQNMYDRGEHLGTMQNVAIKYLNNQCRFQEIVFSSAPRKRVFTVESHFLIYLSFHHPHFPCEFYRHLLNQFSHRFAAKKKHILPFFFAMPLLSLICLPFPGG